ncbi:MAG: hypothetical protein M3N18_04650 [Actinomycetota bacterium]|nr:hypothetical protein [Actinomycetota bacterium]
MRRLEGLQVRLEACTEASRKDEAAAALSQDALRRMTDEELKTCAAALRRASEAGTFSEEDRPILERAEELYEEVSRGFEAQA